MLDRWRKRGEKRRAGDDDPRGGMQDDEYRHADPRDVIIAQGIAMSGPGGAPQEETSAEERRSDDRG